MRSSISNVTHVARRQRAVRVATCEVSGREFEVLLDALDPVRRPTTTRLEEPEAQAGVTLEHTGETQSEHRGHLLERVADDVRACVGALTVLADGVDAAEVRLVQHDRNVERGRGRPQWFERRIVDRSPADAVRAHHASDEAVVLDAANKLVDGKRGILLGQQRNPDQPARIGLAVRREPVVVGATERGSRLRVLVQAVHETEAREQHGGVDSFLVEHAHALDRVATTGAVDPSRRDMGLRSAGQLERSAATACPR